MSDTINGAIRWSGEHWINYIRPPGAESDSGSFSLFHTCYSEAGAGTVAFVDIPGAGFLARCTDNRALADEPGTEQAVRPGLAGLRRDV